MPEKPRRILEKSRTLRRRYQRSNKRFQFTASQIERIEREEERERRAAKLREKEKKLREKKKRKVEKEAKAREERKRLGLPDPNAPKVSSSQPLLLNFFGAKKPPQPTPEEQSSDTESSDGEESGVNNNIGVGQDAIGEMGADDGRTDTGRSDAGQDSDRYSDLDDEGDLSEAETVVMDNEENVNENAVNAALNGLCSPDQVRRHIQSLGDSFEDDTSRLLQELLPDELGINDNINKERARDHTLHYTSTPTGRPADDHPVIATMSGHLSHNIQNGGIPSPCLDARRSQPAGNRHAETAAGDISEPLVDIYQDPEDILAGISTQDLADDDDCDDFDDKENVHPNILPGARLQARATPRRPKPYSKLQVSVEREPLSLLNRETSPELDDELCKSPSIRPRQMYTPKDIHKAAGMSTGSSSRCFSAPASHLSVPANHSKTGSISDDEFDDLDLTPSELEALTAL